MRISGLVVFILLISTIGFVYLGFSEPEFSFRTQVNISAPVDISYAAFTDTSKSSAWVADLVRVDLLRGDSGAVNSFYRLNFVQDDKDVIATQHLLAIDINTRVAYDVEFPNMNTSVEVLFESSSDGTRIATYNTVRAKGLYWQAVLRLQKGSLIERQQIDYRKLKAMVESR